LNELLQLDEQRAGIFEASNESDGQQTKQSRLIYWPDFVESRATELFWFTEFTSMKTKLKPQEGTEIMSLKSCDSAFVLGAIRLSTCFFSATQLK